MSTASESIDTVEIFGALTLYKICRGPGQFGEVFLAPGQSMPSTAYHAEILTVPRGTTRQEVFQRMKEMLPEYIRDGAIMFFSAERNDFGEVLW